MRHKSENTHRVLSYSVAGFAALGLVMACAAPSPADENAEVPLRCGVVAEKLAGATALHAWVMAEAGAVGDYRFEISGPGARISQGGGFEAVAYEHVTLGSATLPGPASRYDVRLSVNSGGAALVCTSDASEI